MEKNNWLLLRGLARGTGHWGPFADLFQKKFREDKIYFLDLPGNGLCNQLRSPTQISEYTDFIRKSYQGHFPLNIVALSMGAMIAVDWQVRFPQEVEQTFLINTSAANFSKVYHRLRLQNFKQYWQVLTAKNKQLAILKFTAPPDISQDTVRQLEAFTNNYPVKFQNIFNQLLAAAKFTFPNICPKNVTLISSAKDKMVSPQCSQDIAKRWQLPILVHPQAGHDLPLYDPIWLTEQIYLKVKS